MVLVVEYGALVGDRLFEFDKVREATTNVSYVPCGDVSISDGDVCGMGLRVSYMGEVIGGCKSCDWEGACGYCLYELLSNNWNAVFKGLFGDGFANGNFLVDVIVDDCCWGGVWYMGYGYL